MDKIYTRAVNAARGNLELADMMVEFAEAEMATLKAENMCDVCGGTGKPVSGKPCMCAGTGKMSEAVRYLRRELYNAEAARTGKRTARKLCMDIECFDDTPHYAH